MPRLLDATVLEDYQTPMRATHDEQLSGSVKMAKKTTSGDLMREIDQMYADAQDGSKKE